MTATTLAISADTRIALGDPNTPGGSQTQLIVGELDSQTGATFRSLVKAATLSDGTIPTTAMVLSAYLYFYIDAVSAVKTSTNYIYRVKRAWTEAGCTWNKYDGTNSWSTAGLYNNANDIDTTAVGSFTANGAAGTWASCSLDAAKIQEMINGTFANNGFLIKSSGEVNDAVFYSSREGANDPYMVVNFYLPLAGNPACMLSDYGVL